MSVFSIIIYFAFYSLVGWIYESTMYTVKQKKFINRGFLNGPCCPIYGFGAVVDIICLSKLTNPIALFFAGMLLCCSLEFFTGWLLEKLFHARWWDYSKRKFNIKGYVCLLGALVFGSMSVFLILFIHPFISGILDKLPKNVVMWISLGLVALYAIDTIATVIQLTKFNVKLKAIQAHINDVVADTLDRAGTAKQQFGTNARTQFTNAKQQLETEKQQLENNARTQLENAKQQFENTELFKRLNDTVEKTIANLSRREKNLSKYLQFNSTKYSEAIQKIREFLNTKK